MLCSRGGLLCLPDQLHFVNTVLTARLRLKTSIKTITYLSDTGCLEIQGASLVISFASGLVVMFFIIMARKETRQQFAAIPSLIKNRKVPLWNWFAGLCGAMVVFSEGASASALGVATFQTALISALLLSGLLCDRFGIGVDEKKYFTPYRIIGALFAVIATIFVVSPQWHSTSFILLAILPFLAGLLAGWQPAGNAKVAEATGSMLVSIT